MKKLIFIFILIANRFKFDSHYGEYFAWDFRWCFRGMRLVYNSKKDDFDVEPENWRAGYERCIIDDNTWVELRHQYFLNWFKKSFLPKIRKMARTELLKELPEMKKSRNFGMFLKKDFPKTTAAFKRWLAFQSCIYRGYGTSSTWTQDFFELYGLTINKKDIYIDSKKLIEIHYRAEQMKPPKPRIKSEDIHLAKSCPDQYSKEALETIVS